MIYYDLSQFYNDLIKGEARKKDEENMGFIGLGDFTSSYDVTKEKEKTGEEWQLGRKKERKTAP